MSLSWLPPEKPNGIILDYEIKYHEKVRSNQSVTRESVSTENSAETCNASAGQLTFFACAAALNDSFLSAELSSFAFEFFFASLAHLIFFLLLLFHALFSTPNTNIPSCPLFPSFLLSLILSECVLLKVSVFSTSPESLKLLREENNSLKSARYLSMYILGLVVFLMTSLLVLQDQGEAIAHTMTAQRSNARIEGLKAGTPYVVQVRARTVAGYGRYSSPADFSTNLQSTSLSFVPHHERIAGEICQA